MGLFKPTLAASPEAEQTPHRPVPKEALSEQRHHSAAMVGAATGSSGTRGHT